MDLTPDILELYEQARDYDLKGDTYNAVKLYKRIAKMAPEWAPPFVCLGVIYKLRGEWKPALHYTKRAIAIDSTLQSAWWDMGIAATALKKWRLSRNVWSKFGFAKHPAGDLPLVAVRLKYGGHFEILWATRLDPARCTIQNIPHPDSERRFRDIVLLDGLVSGYNIIRKKRYPVFDELGLFKRSAFHTFSCVLEAATPSDIQHLEQLCRQADLGFEVWSNASRQQYLQPSQSLPEYYQNPEIIKEQPAATQVAFAARREKQVVQILKTWETISLKSYTALQCHL